MSSMSISTPINGNVIQELVYTHEYELIWPVNSCRISFEIKDGNTSYLTTYGTDSEPLIHTTLHLFPYISIDEGTYTKTIVAYYEEYSEPDAPTQTLETEVNVTVEP